MNENEKKALEIAEKIKNSKKGSVFEGIFCFEDCVTAARMMAIWKDSEKPTGEEINKN